jgi:hypothetical protein
MKAQEILLVEQQLIQEGMLSNIKNIATNIYSKFKDVLPQAKEIKSTVAANKDDILNMFAEFRKLKSENKLTPEAVMQGFSKLANTVAQELPPGTVSNTRLSEGSLAPLDESIDSWFTLIYQWVDYIVNDDFTIYFRLQNSDFGDMSWLVYIPGLWQIILTVVTIIIAKMIFRSKSVKSQPQAQKSETNIPTLTDVASAKAQDNEKLLSYSVYLYALQQMYGQDTSKTKTALQQYIKAGGDRARVNTMFNDTVTKLRANSTTAEKLAQEFLNPAKSSQIINNLLQSVGGQHEEF